MSDQRSWPPGRSFPDAQTIEATCSTCALRWRVHEDLAGGRVACECGAWVQVPNRHAPLPLPMPMLESLSAEVSISGAGDGLGPEPATHEVDALHKPVEADEVRRFSSRTVIELCLLLLALGAPPTAVSLLTDPRTHGLLMPLSGLLSGILVLVVGALTQGVGFSGLRASKPKYFVEAALVVIPVLGVAFGLSWVLRAVGAVEDMTILELREHLGLGMALFAVALCPAVFEEIAFRGVLHARCRQLFGSAGVPITAAAFALAHGLQPFLVIHFGIGFYLSRLRDRSLSLLPGMVTHFLYNAGIVTLF